MKIKTLISLTLTLLLLCGCGKASPPAPTVAEEYADLPTTAPAEPAQLAEDAIAAYGDFLNGKTMVWDPEGQQEVPISKISRFFTPEELPWNVVRIAVLDLHGDGIPEAVLEVSNDIGFVLLGYQEDGDVYGYGIWHRAFQNLKADGSFMATGSSFNHSYYKQHPSGDILLAECYEDTDGTRHYWVDGEEVDEAAFLTFEAEQSAKPDATWYGEWLEYLVSR